jgi:hypothetical protein
MADIERPDNSGVSRRTVTKAMAWAVPAVAVAATAPIAAASCIPQFGIAAGSCKKANASSYYLIFDLNGDPTCTAPPECDDTAVVYALRYKGNQNIFWGATNNPAPTPVGTGITVCGINPANFIQAYVSSPCINNGEPFWTDSANGYVDDGIAMPQVSTGKCTDDPTFCA